MMIIHHRGGEQAELAPRILFTFCCALSLGERREKKKTPEMLTCAAGRNYIPTGLNAFSL
jgi:hypothetical protein